MSLGKDTHLCAPRPRRGRREGCVPVKGLCACAVSVAPRQPRSSRLSPCASLGLPRAVGVGFPVHPGLFLFAAQHSSVAWVTPFDLSLLRTLWVPPSFWVLRMELLQAAVHTSLQARFLSFLAEVCSAHSALFLVCSQWSGLGVSCRSVAGGAGARLRRAGSGGAAGPWPLALGPELRVTLGLVYVALYVCASGPPSPGSSQLPSAGRWAVFRICEPGLLCVCV